MAAIIASIDDRELPCPVCTPSTGIALRFGAVAQRR
jgi:hypothetical protein